VVVAGGSGTRYGGYKQFAVLGGREVLDWSLVAARRACSGVVLVVPEGLVARYRSRATCTVAGGRTRGASVRCGLVAVPSDAGVIVVHDAARPLASDRIWDVVIEAVRGGADAAVPCVPVLDTVKQRQADGCLETLDRGRLVAAQTPQAFLAGALRAAHAGGGEATDDAALVEAMGGRVVEVAGEPSNLKLTGPADLALAEALLSMGAQPADAQPAGAQPAGARSERTGGPR
jgi:2-C-methyl-D-erythritol 4-phosphate cytidylyltransferase